ncbi:hypothetical protein ScPMuIL_011103 [Solemya velum]
MLIATWDNVGFYGAAGGGDTKRNTFQCVLVTDRVQSYAIFNYHHISWTTGANSGGDVNTGLGGKAAQAGFNAGDKSTSYSIAGAQTADVLNLTFTSNVDIPGKWVFRVDSAAIQDIDCELEDRLVILPRSSSMMGGEALRISGPCFKEDWEVIGRILETETEFLCAVMNFRTIECVLPPMFFVGEVTIQLNPNGHGWNYSTVFTIVNLLSVENDVVRVDVPGWVVGNSVKVTWDPRVIPSNDTRLELLGIRFTNSVPILETILTEPVPSTSQNGAMEFMLDTRLGSYSAAVVHIVGKKRNIFPSIWSDVFPVRWDIEQKSKQWCESWINYEKDLNPIIDIHSTCPCTLRQAMRDTGRYHQDPLYFYKLRFPTNCQLYQPPTPAQAAGDPHLVTLDGLEYTFNGIGEYVLVEDKNSSVVIQVRAVPTQDKDGRSQNASVFSAIALALRNSSDVVEIRLSERQLVETLVNGRVLTLNTYLRTERSESNESLASYLVVLEATSVSVSIDVTPDLLNILVMIGSDMLQGQTLVQVTRTAGNYNGKNKEDDSYEGWHGTSNSSMSNIHSCLVSHRQVEDEENCFLKYGLYPEFQSYSPVFLDALADEQLLVRCPHLTVPENGNRSVLSYTVGSEATYTCYPEATMVSGTAKRTCRENGQWDGEEVTCAKAVGDQSSSLRRILIISLSTASGILVFVIAAILVYACCKHKRKEEDAPSVVELPNIFCEPSDIPRPVFENPSFLLSLHRLNEGGGFHIPRPHYQDPLVIRDYF